MARGGSRNARGEPPEEAEEPMAEEAVDPLQLAAELPPLPEVPEHAAAQQPNPANVPVPPGYDGPPVQAPQNPQNVIPNNNDWRYGDNFQGQLIDYSTKQGRAMPQRDFSKKIRTTSSIVTQKAYANSLLQFANAPIIRAGMTPYTVSCTSQSRSLTIDHTTYAATMVLLK